MFGIFGNYVNNTAKGDPAIVEKSGFPSCQTGHVVDLSQPAAPTDLRLRHADGPGGILARYRPGCQPSTNELQINLGDPNNEAGW